MLAPQRNSFPLCCPKELLLRPTLQVSLFGVGNLLQLNETFGKQQRSVSEFIISMHLSSEMYFAFLHHPLLSTTSPVVDAESKARDQSSLFFFLTLCINANLFEVLHSRIPQLTSSLTLLKQKAQETSKHPFTFVTAQEHSKSY